MKRQKKLVVVAGNQREFWDYCKEKNISPPGAVYADSRERIIGLRHYEVVYVGSFIRRWDFKEIEIEIRFRKSIGECVEVPLSDR